MTKSLPNKSVIRRKNVDFPHPESPATPIKTTRSGFTNHFFFYLNATFAFIKWPRPRNLELESCDFYLDLGLELGRWFRLKCCLASYPAARAIGDWRSSRPTTDKWPAPATFKAKFLLLTFVNHLTKTGLFHTRIAEKLLLLNLGRAFSRSRR